MGDVGVVQIFVQLRNRLVHCQTDEIDLRRYREGLGHLDSALRGFALAESPRRLGAVSSCAAAACASRAVIQAWAGDRGLV